MAHVEHPKLRGPKESKEEKKKLQEENNN